MNEHKIRAYLVGVIYGFIIAMFLSIMAIALGVKKFLVYNALNENLTYVIPFIIGILFGIKTAKKRLLETPKPSLEEQLPKGRKVVYTGGVGIIYGFIIMILLFGVVEKLYEYKTLRHNKVIWTSIQLMPIVVGALLGAKIAQMRRNK